MIVMVYELLLVLFLCMETRGVTLTLVTSIGIVHRESCLSKVMLVKSYRRAGQRVTKLSASLIAIVMS